MDDVRQIHNCRQSRSQAERLTMMIRVLHRGISVSRRSHMQVCSDLFDLYAAVYPTSRTVWNLIVRRSESRLLGGWSGCEETIDPRE